MTSEDKHVVDMADAAVRKAEKQARRHYAILLPDAKIDYSLRGRCAGQARVNRNGDTLIRLNFQLLKENLDDFLTQTIPHEVAHLVINWQSRKKSRRPRPHGDEWQEVMQECFGLRPIRCHTYKTTAARKVKRNFLYQCACGQHQLTSIMHNKISRHQNAFCKSCRTRLEFTNKLSS